jgi:hypothetical protein
VRLDVQRGEGLDKLARRDRARDTFAIVTDSEEWLRHLRVILDATADTKRVLEIAESAIGISNAVHGGAAQTAEAGLPRLVTLVRSANVSRHGSASSR